jgi:hypothetical protein
MITGVAIKKDGVVYSLPKPNRHHDVIRMMIRDYEVAPHSGEQGFIDNLGDFYLRKPAKLIAILNNQLIARAGNDEELFSEDVW